MLRAPGVLKLTNDCTVPCGGKFWFKFRRLELNTEITVFSRHYHIVFMDFVSSRKWILGLIASRGRKNITGIPTTGGGTRGGAGRGLPYPSVQTRLILYDCAAVRMSPVSGAGFHTVGSAKRRLLGADLVGHVLPIHSDAQIGLAQVRADGPFRLAPHITRALPIEIRSPKLCHCYPATITVRYCSLER